MLCRCWPDKRNVMIMTTNPENFLIIGSVYKIFQCFYADLLYMCVCSVYVHVSKFECGCTCECACAFVCAWVRHVAIPMYHGKMENFLINATVNFHEVFI